MPKISLYFVQKNIIIMMESSKMLRLAGLGKSLQRNTKKQITATLIGVVTDITNAVKQKTGNYVIMLRLIDETLNDENIFGVMCRDCCVYLVSPHKEQISILQNIGDLVVLDKFAFSLWNGIKLETTYQGTTEGLYQFRVNHGNKQISSLRNISKNPQLFELTDVIRNRLNELAEWSKERFTSVYRPKIGISILNTHCVMIEPFNMILKYKQIIEENEDTYIHELSDNNHNHFYIRTHDKNYQVNELLLIRSIKSIGQQFFIQLTEAGHILRIPDFPEFRTFMNYMAIHHDKERFAKERKDNVFTVIQGNSLQLSFLNDLFELQDRYNHTHRKDEIVISDVYRVEAIIVSYTGRVQLYHRQYQIIVNEKFYEELSPEQKVECLEKHKIGYIYEGVLGLLDRSNDSKPKPFYVHLFSCDTKGAFLDPEIMADYEDKFPNHPHAINKLEELVHHKLDKLIAKSSYERPFILLLEPIRSQKLLFRMINTKII